MTWEDLQDSFYITVTDKDDSGKTYNTYYKRYEDGMGRLWVVSPPSSAPGITLYLFTLAIIDEKNFRIKYLPTVDLYRCDEWESLRYCDPRNDFSELEQDSIKYGIEPAWGKIDKMILDELQPDVLVKYIVTRVCKELNKLTGYLNDWVNHLERKVRCKPKMEEENSYYMNMCFVTIDT